NGNELGAALPYNFGGPYTVSINVGIAGGADRFGPKSNSVVTNVPYVDVGPWNENDPYALNGGRPQAEAQCFEGLPDDYGRIPKYPDGLDLTPAVWRALGFRGSDNSFNTKVIWWWPNQPFSGYYPFQFH